MHACIVPSVVRCIRVCIAYELWALWLYTNTHTHAIVWWLQGNWWSHLILLTLSPARTYLKLLLLLLLLPSRKRNGRWSYIARDCGVEWSAWKIFWEKKKGRRREREKSGDILERRAAAAVPIYRRRRRREGNVKKVSITAKGWFLFFLTRPHVNPYRTEMLFLHRF